MLGYFDRFGDHKAGLISLLFVSVVLNLGYGILVPFIPIFAQNIGASIGVIGFIVSAFTIGRAVSASIAGDYSDRMGRKRVMLVGTLIYSVSTGLMAFAENWQTLLLLRIIEGTAVGIVWPTAQAHLIDLVPPEKVGEATGIYTTTLTFGFFGGPLIGSFLFFIVEVLGGTHFQALVAPFFGTASFAFFSFLAVLITIQDVSPFATERSPGKSRDTEQSQEPIQYRANVPNPRREYLKYYGMSLLNGLGIGFIIPIFSIYFVDFHGFNEAAIGVILGIGGGITSLISGPSGWLSDKFGRRPLMIWGIPLMVLSTIALGFVGTFLMAGTFFWIRAIGNGLYIPSFRSLQASVVLPFERGKIFGRTQTAFNVGAVIGPIIGSYIYDVLQGQTYSILKLSLPGEAVPFVMTGLIQALMIGIIFILQFPLISPKGPVIKVDPSVVDQPIESIGLSLD